MNLVWFQDGFCQWDTTAGSFSITQSEESRFNLWFTFIQSQVRTKYEFCESVKTRGYAEIHTELKLSDPMDIRLYHMRSIFYTSMPLVQSALALTRLLTLVQVGVCRRYALEAIINDIIYLRVHNYVYVPCYNCYGSWVCNNHEARR